LFSKVGQIDLRLNTSWEVMDLNDADLDFAIRYMGEAEDGMESLWLMRSGVVPVCTPDFAKRYSLNADHWDVTGVPLVHITVPTTDPDWADWPRWKKEMGLSSPKSSDAQPRYELAGSGVRLATSGVGLVLGGLSEVYGALDEGRLIMPFGQASVLPGQYAHKLIWSADRRLGPVQRMFRDWIDEKAKSDRELMQRIFGLAQV
jgi:DNA-binding transcriptional LysR family regulator